HKLNLSRQFPYHNHSLLRRNPSPLLHNFHSVSTVQALDKRREPICDFFHVAILAEDLLGSFHVLYEAHILTTWLPTGDRAMEPLGGGDSVGRMS
ncbi:hypothetical protein LEMLEM_LOCUS6993, partial [Lemmus lemmus]